jgi:hypothetical protein
MASMFAVDKVIEGLGLEFGSAKRHFFFGIWNMASMFAVDKLNLDQKQSF